MTILKKTLMIPLSLSVLSLFTIQKALTNLIINIRQVGEVPENVYYANRAKKFTENNLTSGLFDARNISNVKSVRIVLWTRDNNDLTDPGTVRHSQDYCSEYNMPGQCVFVLNRTNYQNADGIIMLGRPKGFIEKQGKPRIRHSWQLYVIYTWESSANVFLTQKTDFGRFLSTPNNYFNLTSTFRSDSDLPIPYWTTGHRDTPCSSCLPNSTILNEKKYFLTWIVSNCHALNEREKYFEEISKYIKTEKYGGCGRRLPSCGRNVQGHGCTLNIIKKSKFYFSAENAICKDYITEKLFRPLIISTIPVVLATKDVRKIAPPNSYIDINNFQSPKHLAVYLLYLDKNHTAYMEYFRWRENYYVTKGSRGSTNVFCKLCNYIHTKNESRVVNFKQWFHDKSECKNPFSQ